MLFETKGPFFPWANRRRRRERSRPNAPENGDGRNTANPRVQYAMRAGVPVASPQLRVGELAEMLRVSSYHGVPVGSPLPQGAVHFDGWVSEANTARFLLTAATDAERKTLLQTALADVPDLIRTPTGESLVHGGAFVTDAARQMDESGENILFVVDGSGAFLGLIGRGDLVRELSQPLRPPVIGGMATPLGVYLTTGSVSGGVGTLALMLTGLVMFMAFLGSVVLTQPLLRFLQAHPLGRVNGSEGLPLLFLSLVQTALYLFFVRISPLAGYHAAEHQTVHAVERSYPLLPQYVRIMPRVHPRCGTNLVAGGLLLTTTASVVQALFDTLGWQNGEAAGYAVWGIAAFVAWANFRTVGSFLQQFITTRPANDKEIASGIYAARIVLEKHEARIASYSPPALPLVRLWHMGFLQIFAGFWAGFAILWAVGWCFPAFRAASAPWLRDVMF